MRNSRFFILKKKLFDVVTVVWSICRNQYECDIYRIILSIWICWLVNVEQMLYEILNKKDEIVINMFL